MKSNYSEARLQSLLWEWAWNTYPQFRRQMWAVPNGLKLSLIQAVTAKATGMLTGVWDLHVFNKGQFHIIETKIDNNKLSPNQIVWGDLMALHGATRHIYYTLEEGQTIYKLIFNEKN